MFLISRSLQKSHSTCHRTNHKRKYVQLWCTYLCSLNINFFFLYLFFLPRVTINNIIFKRGMVVNNVIPIRYMDMAIFFVDLFVFSYCSWFYAETLIYALCLCALNGYLLTGVDQHWYIDWWCKFFVFICAPSFMVSPCLGIIFKNTAS